MGAGTEAALERLRSRSASQAVALIVAAMQVQRRSGGDLAKVLRGVATALEQDRQVIEEANAATAQARFTAMVVVALPLCGIGLGTLASPDLPARMTGSPVGAGLLMASLALQLSRRAPDPPACAVVEVSLAAVCAAAAAVLAVLGARDALHGRAPPSPVRLRAATGRLPGAVARRSRCASARRSGMDRVAAPKSLADRVVAAGSPGRSAASATGRRSSARARQSHCSEPR